MNANLERNIPDSQDFVSGEADKLRPGRHESDGQDDAQVAFENPVRLLADVGVEEVDDTALIGGGYQVHLRVVVEAVHSAVGNVEVGS